jgi:hypothetical protein
LATLNDTTQIGSFLFLVTPPKVTGACLVTFVISETVGDRDMSDMCQSPWAV